WQCGLDLHARASVRRPPGNDGPYRRVPGRSHRRERACHSRTGEHPPDQILNRPFDVERVIFRRRKRLAEADMADEIKETVQEIDFGDYAIIDTITHYFEKKPEWYWKIKPVT